MKPQKISSLQSKQLNVQDTASSPVNDVPAQSARMVGWAPPGAFPCSVAIGTNQTSTPYGPHSIDENELKTAQFLVSARRRGVSQSVLHLLEQDLSPSENEAALREAVSKAYPAETDNKSIFKALEVAKRAHQGQFQQRKSEPDSGLQHIPYLNHPIQLARHALQLGSSSACIQACLLHDVVEDTRVSLDELKTQFSPRVVSLVVDLTQTKDETRAAYLDRVSKLEGDASVIKGLDRKHNLLRAFTSKDADYIERYLKESIEVYGPKFKNNPTLNPLQGEFTTLIEELKQYAAVLNRPVET